MLSFKQYGFTQLNEVYVVISDCNWTRTHSQLVYKQTLSHLAQLAKWLSCVVSTYLYSVECGFTLKRVRHSFILHDVIDCFNHRIDHAALFQSNTRWKWNFQDFIEIFGIFSKIPVSHTEAYESW